MSVASHPRRPAVRPARQHGRTGALAVALVLLLAAVSLGTRQGPAPGGSPRAVGVIHHVTVPAPARADLLDPAPLFDLTGSLAAVLAGLALLCWCFGLLIDVRLRSVTGPVRTARGPPVSD